MSNEIVVSPRAVCGEAVPASVLADLPEGAHVPSLNGETGRRWFEVCLVLLLAVGSSFLSSVYLLNFGREGYPAAGPFRWVNATFHEGICLLLLVYVLSRRGRRLQDLGLRWSVRDFFVGIGITVAAYLSYLGGWAMLQGLHRAMFGSVTPGGLTAHQMFAHPSYVAIPFFLLNPFFEETIVRAYLMTEVRALTGSWTLAAALSIVVQTSYHLYYGWMGALSLSFQFLIFAIYYARTQKATPIVVAHGIFDIVGLIRLW